MLRLYSRSLIQKGKVYHGCVNHIESNKIIDDLIILTKNVINIQILEIFYKKIGGSLMQMTVFSCALQQAELSGIGFIGQSFTLSIGNNASNSI